MIISCCQISVYFEKLVNIITIHHLGLGCQALIYRKLRLNPYISKDYISNKPDISDQRLFCSR